MDEVTRAKYNEARREANALRGRAYVKLGRRLGWDGFIAAVHKFVPIRNDAS